MKAPFALLIFAAALAAAPVQAGGVFLRDNNPVQAYAMKVTFVSTLYGEDARSACAKLHQANELQDPIRSVQNIMIYKPGSCDNGTPDIQSGAPLREYAVPGTPSLNRNFMVTIDQKGGIQIVER